MGFKFVINLINQSSTIFPLPPLLSSAEGETVNNGVALSFTKGNAIVTAAFKSVQGYITDT